MFQDLSTCSSSHLVFLTTLARNFNAVRKHLPQNSLRIWWNSLVPVREDFVKQRSVPKETIPETTNCPSTNDNEHKSTSEMLGYLDTPTNEMQEHKNTSTNEIHGHIQTCLSAILSAVSKEELHSMLKELLCKVVSPHNHSSINPFNLVPINRSLFCV